MMATKPRIAMIHYSAPPVIGGVEAVMEAHTRLFLAAGFRVRIVAGIGAGDALDARVEFVQILELDSQDTQNLELSKHLEAGSLPPGFAERVSQLEEKLMPALADADVWIIHNLLTKHFNLAATAALCSLIARRPPKRAIAWCHDFTWTSPNSAHKVFPGYPWDILRTPLEGVRYVTVSAARQRELASLFGVPADLIEVVYNGVDPQILQGLSPQVEELSQQLGLFESDLIVLMPVRITQAKNFEFALRLLAELRSRLPNPRLIVTGPPDPHEASGKSYFQELKVLRKSLGLEQFAIFLTDLIGERLELAGVGELYRLSDLLLIPSHREGFGIPVLEAGLLGIPVASTAIPAAVEIGQQEILLLDASRDPALVSQDLLSWLESQPHYRLKRRVRRSLTWQAIFQSHILPLVSI